MSEDDKILMWAGEKAAVPGASVDPVIREYLNEFAVNTNVDADAAEFEELSQQAQGNRRGWTFNRDELHERR